MTNYTKPVFGVSPFCYSEKAKDFQKGDIVKMKQLGWNKQEGRLTGSAQRGKDNLSGASCAAVECRQV